MKTNVKQLPLILGTAQLGFPYGIANKVGKMTQRMVDEIVWEAWKCGIRRFDTAQNYGESEVLLGKALGQIDHSKEAKIISKIDPVLNHLDFKAVINSVDKSLERLKIKQLYAILIHNEESLSLWNKGLDKICIGLVNSGKAEKIGVSIYSPDKALWALDIPELGILQIPTNILDRRFKEQGVFQKARTEKKEIYIRSVFLQGLLLMRVGEIPKKMDFVKPVLKDLNMVCLKNKISAQRLALGYLKRSIPEAYFIFGAEKVEQIQDNVRGLDTEISASLCKEIELIFNNVDERILNPSLWP